SIVGMLALNFFFFQPLYTFRIAESQNWIALIAFLIVSVVASQLSSAVQTRARERIEFLNERKKTELIRQRADLASSLLASLSHDLRTPLTAVTVAVENLQDPALSTDERRRQAQ